jgi:hypothetical protein
MLGAMRVMQLEEPGSSLIEIERPIPAPLEGQLLLHVEACGVCRTDLHVCAGIHMSGIPAMRPGSKAARALLSGAITIRQPVEHHISRRSRTRWFIGRTGLWRRLPLPASRVLLGQDLALSGAYAQAFSSNGRSCLCSTKAAAPTATAREP